MNRHIWEIKVFFVCPVAGTCLSISEIKRILNKAKLDCTGMSDYDLHQYVIDEMRKESFLSKRIEKYLNSKFKKEMGVHSRKNFEEWFEYFKKEVDEINLASFIWISATAVKMTSDQAYLLFGELHMYMHKVILKSADCMNDLRRAEADLKEREQKYFQLLAKYETQQALLQEKEREIRRVSSLHIAEKKEGNRDTADQHNRRKLERSRNKLNSLLRRNSALLEEREELREKIAFYESAFENVKHDLAETIAVIEKDKCEKCRFKEGYEEICPRKILIVGGLEKLKSFYEEIVRNMNFEFEYHTGECKNGEELLQARIVRADVVLCPADINSHSACLAVKKFCKKYRKDYHILRKSSISTIHNTLRSITENTLHN